VEPFRWDQRLFTIVLKPTTSPDAPTVGSEAETVAAPMSEVTGGRCHIVNSMKSLFLTIESLTQRLFPVVVVDIEKLPAPLSSPDVLPWSSPHRFLYIRSNTGNWPLPEPFLPDPSMQTLVLLPSSFFP
jgi:hypothetical protein